MTTLVDHKAERPGPTRLRVRATSASISVRVSPDADRAEALVSTRDNTGLSARSVLATTMRETPGLLAIDVPQDETSGQTFVVGSGTVFAGSVGTLIVGDVHGPISFGDQPAVQFGSSRILIQVTLPAGSSLETQTGSGDLTVSGDLVEANVRSVSAGLRLDRVRDLRARTVSGSVDVAGLTGPAEVKTVSGSIDLVAAVETRVRARTVSGNITVTGARVELDARTVTGRVRQR